MLDIATGRETPLTEARSVEDQVEWLDDDHVVYGLPGEGTHAPRATYGPAPADGTGTPACSFRRRSHRAVVR